MKRISILLFALVVLGLAACGPAPVAGETPEAPGSVEGPSEGQTIQGQVYLSEAALLIMESYPVQVAIQLTGDLPTPCHTLGAKIAAPNAENEIHVEIFSEAAADVMCVQVLQPFEERISLPMEGQPDGIYRVFLNGEPLGEFSYPG